MVASESCPQCQRETPSLDYCCRCGFALGAAEPAVPARRAARAQFAAAPNEPAWGLRLASTFFPQLPARDLTAFRLALGSGLVVIVGLGLAGLFPVGLVAASVLVPLLMLLYLYDTDVYEDEPLRVVGATMAWGAFAGVVLGSVLRVIDLPIVPPGVAQYAEPGMAVRVFVIPVAGLALALIGPVALLRYRRFNDVLDGATFASAAGVTLVAAQTLVVAWPVFTQGARPDQEAITWTIRLVELAVLVPVITAGAAGWIGAALWLRFRAPTRDRDALGAFGNPMAAVVTGAVLVTAAAVVQRLQGRAAVAAALTVFAGLAVVLLRRAVHVGLLEEADELEPGPDVVCANCHRLTPRHHFCGHCGVALRALPKTPPPGETA
jgi:hypothetical protein